MCGCSPVCKSFFDTFRAAGSFVHVSGLSMRLIFVAGRHGVLDSGSSSATRTLRSAVGKWFSRSRPCDRLHHERSRNSPPLASDEDALGEFRSKQSGQALMTSFSGISPSLRDIRERGADCFVSGHTGAHPPPINPFRDSPDPSRSEPRFSGQPREGEEQPHHQPHPRFDSRAPVGHFPEQRVVPPRAFGLVASATTASASCDRSAARVRPR